MWCYSIARKTVTHFLGSFWSGESSGEYPKFPNWPLMFWGSLGLVAFFVWDFQFNQMDMEHSTLKTSALGIVMMVGYVTVDSFTSNFEEMGCAWDDILGLVGSEWLLGLKGIWGWILHDFSSFWQRFRVVYRTSAQRILETCKWSSPRIGVLCLCQPPESCCKCEIWLK